MEDRILKLEIEMENFRKEVGRMHASALALTDEVRSIQKTLNQIKYFAGGAIAFLVSSEVGIVEVIKGIL